MNAVIYLRVSHRASVAGYSLEVQEQACLRYAAARGWLVVGTYRDEAISASRRTVEQRGAFQRLLADLKLRDARAVIVFELDRAFRNLREQLNVFYDLQQRRVQLCSVEDRIDTGTPEGVLEFQLKGAVSEYQARQMGRKIRHSLAFKRERGGWLGRAPLGYDVTPGGLVPNADAETVRLLGAWYATGQYSHRSLADALNAAGHVARDKVGAAIPFTANTIRIVLRNPIYATLGLWRADEQMAIEAVRKQRAGQGRQGLVMHSRGPALLSRVARCAECGAPMHAQPTHKGLDTHGQPRNRRWYYHCRAARDGRHEHRYVLAWPGGADQQILTLLGGLTLPASCHGAIRAYAASRIQEAARPAVDPHAARRNALSKALADGVLTEAEYAVKLAALPVPVAASPRLVPLLDDLLGLLSDMPRLLAAMTDDERRQLVRRLFVAVYLAPEPHRIVAVQPREGLADVLAAVRETAPQQMLTPAFLNIALWKAYKEPLFAAS